MNRRLEPRPLMAQGVSYLSERVLFLGCLFDQGALEELAPVQYRVHHAVEFHTHGASGKFRIVRLSIILPGFVRPADDNRGFVAHRS